MVISGIYYIAIICSQGRSLAFYHSLGLRMVSRVLRSEHHNEIVMLSFYSVTLELFIALIHSTNMTNSEVYGLCHLALKGSSSEQVVDVPNKYNHKPIRTDIFIGERMTFVKDPYGLTIELYE